MTEPDHTCTARAVPFPTTGRLDGYTFDPATGLRGTRRQHAHSHPHPVAPATDPHHDNSPRPRGTK